MPTFALNVKLRPDPQEVASSLARLWSPDENIVYIGKDTCLNQFRRKNMSDLHIFFCRLTFCTPAGRGVFGLLAQALSGFFRSIKRQHKAPT